jgi:hypothetical protein
MTKSIVAGIAKVAVKTAGDIYKDVDRYIIRMQRGMTLGTREAGRGLQNALREQVRLAGLGPKVEKTWQGKAFPAGSEYSMSPAYIVFSKAPKLIDAYDKGVTIRAKKGMFLAIPTEDAPEVRMRGRTRVQVTPATWPAKTYGELRFVAGKHGYSFLVAPGLRRSYRKKDGAFRGFKKASDAWTRANKRTEDVVMFILIPQARLKKKLDVKREYQKWSSMHMDLIQKRFKDGN